MTGALDDQSIRKLADRLEYLRRMEEKKEQILSSIEQQGKLTDELRQALEDAETQQALEDISRPFRPKRRTRASQAREKGLEPLANAMLLQSNPVTEQDAAAFVSEEKGVANAEEALQGALDILAEYFSDDASLRQEMRKLFEQEGILCAKAAKEEASVYEMYYDYAEPIKKIPSHRVLALDRGEKEGYLSVKLTLREEQAPLALLCRRIVRKNSPTASWLTKAAEDSLQRLLLPSLQREIRNYLTEQACEQAMMVFRENLRQLLMIPPIKGKVVLAVDPAYRTGCKLAVIDETGSVLQTGVMYATPPRNETEKSEKLLLDWIRKYHVTLISIGNGTASRETERFVAEVLKKEGSGIPYVITNEAGASVYSASALGAAEFPDYDVSLRSAVSIGRRVQDPLAELVKIDPKAIGVGQYQHDMDQKRLGETLGGVVEDCVNTVGVELNTASAALLGYVAGISSAVAKNILAYREANGKFTSRKELLQVPKLGAKTFEQCAGFLRIADGSEPLDATAVHPESYQAARAVLEACGYTAEDLRTNAAGKLKKRLQDPKKTAQDLGIGLPTLEDILSELEKPGRDPREDAPAPILSSEVLEIEDLKEGMVLRGTVRNVTDFGVFVDIGVHQDGLVHISKITDRYIKHPLDAVKLGEIVTVKVLQVDVAKKRIALSMRDV